MKTRLRKRSPRQYTVLPSSAYLPSLEEACLRACEHGAVRAEYIDTVALEQSQKVVVHVHAADASFPDSVPVSFFSLLLFLCVCVLSSFDCAFSFDFASALVSLHSCAFSRSTLFPFSCFFCCVHVALTLSAAVMQRLSHHLPLPLHQLSPFTFVLSRHRSQDGTHPWSARRRARGHVKIGRLGGHEGHASVSVRQCRTTPGRTEMSISRAKERETRQRT